MESVLVSLWFCITDSSWDIFCVKWAAEGHHCSSLLIRAEFAWITALHTSKCNYVARRETGWSRLMPRLKHVVKVALGRETFSPLPQNLWPFLSGHLCNNHSVQPNPASEVAEQSHHSEAGIPQWNCLILQALKTAPSIFPAFKTSSVPESVGHCLTCRADTQFRSSNCHNLFSIICCSWKGSEFIFSSVVWRRMIWIYRPRLHIVVLVISSTQPATFRLWEFFCFWSSKSFAQIVCCLCVAIEKPTQTWHTTRQSHFRCKEENNCILRQCFLLERHQVSCLELTASCQAGTCNLAAI